MSQAKILIDKVLKIEPQLTPNGMASTKAYLGYEDPTTPADLYKYQEELMICREWLDFCDFIKSFNTKHTSYGYKHMVERWASHYIPNGIFIAAAISCNLRYRRAGDPLNPNVHLPISEKSFMRHPDGHYNLRDRPKRQMELKD